MYPKDVAWSDLPDVMLDIPWSAIQFKENHRNTANFSTSCVIGFDFDNGLQTVDGIVDILNQAEVPCYVGITKSHQQPKGSDGLVADRFRVAMLMESRISDPELYRQQLLYFKRVWSTNKECWFDSSCTDPARLFYPCKEIVFSRAGDPLPWVVKKPPKKYTKVVNPTGDFSKVPRWVMQRVKGGPAGKSRHSICYSAAAELASHGFDLEEIVEFLMSGYLNEIGEYDVREAAWYGFNRIKGSQNRAEAVEFATASGRLCPRDR